MINEPTAGAHKILVVDDHEVSRQCTVAALRRSSYLVKHAETATDALETALSWTPDILITDIHLRDSSGWDLIDELLGRWPPDRPRPRVVIVSADPSPSAFESAKRRGIDRYLVKPVSAEALFIAAGIEHESGVSENRGYQPDENDLRDLRQLFRAELKTRIPELDESITSMDMPGAISILHQLIASSAFCRENDLEHRLRSLDDACRQDTGAEAVGRAFYALLSSTRAYLQGIEPSG